MISDSRTRVSKTRNWDRRRSAAQEKLNLTSEHLKAERKHSKKLHNDNHYKFLKESMKDLCRQYLLQKIKIQDETLLRARSEHSLSEML